MPSVDDHAALSSPTACDIEFGELRQDTPWGRLRFMLSDIERAVKNQESLATQPRENRLTALDETTMDSKYIRVTKLDAKREENLSKRKEPKLAKSKDRHLRKKKHFLSHKITPKFEPVNTQLDESLSEDWIPWIKCDTSLNSLDLVELTDQQKCCNAFTKSDINQRILNYVCQDERDILYESASYNNMVEETMCLIQVPNFNFSFLDRKITRRIFSHMDFYTAINAGQTCKYWYTFIRDESIWKEMFDQQEMVMFGDDGDVNIWDELGTDFSTVAPVPMDKSMKVSLNSLVAAVTSQFELPNMMDVTIFMGTYQSFTTTRQLVRKLAQRYQVPNKTDGTVDEIKEYTMSVVCPIRMRVAKLLKRLIETHYSYLDSELLVYIKLFILAIIDQVLLVKQLQISVFAAYNKHHDNSEEITNSSTTLRGLMKRSQVTSITNLSSEEAARQLTLIEFQIFSHIRPVEFFGQAWAKPKAHERAPNIRAMIEHFNTITKWITAEIVSEEKIRNRVKRFVKFIKIAQVLRMLHNYHTLMAVLGGLNEGPIYRLTFTKAEIPPKTQQILEELQALMSAEGSYNAYRLELASCEPPCIPYIGVYLRDLTYFDEGAATDDNRYINFKSKKNVYSVIQLIQKYQKVLYPFKKNERAFHYLDSLNIIPDEDFLGMSRLREPKNAKRADIL